MSSVAYCWYGGDLSRVGIWEAKASTKTRDHKIPYQFLRRNLVDLALLLTALEFLQLKDTRMNGTSANQGLS